MLIWSGEPVGGPRINIYIYHTTAFGDSASTLCVICCHDEVAGLTVINPTGFKRLSLVALSQH